MLASLVLGLIVAASSLVGVAARSAPPPQAVHVTIATGSGILALPKVNGPLFDITSFGAEPGAPALRNQAAINAAIDAAAKAGGGTVVIPAGTFKTFSIRLKSNVGLHFASKDSILRAAVPGTGANRDGGFYDAPEKNPFVGLQDQGHSHWANSLIYGIGVENVTISGPGLIDGSYVDSTGATVDVLTGFDSPEVTSREASGTPGGGNKAIALENATNIIFRDFHIKNGGHFAILGTAVNRWTIDGIVVDTNRDAIDIDTCQNVTVRNSVFNSLTDDAIVMKGSFGAGRYLTSKNILIEHDTVSGYDSGSVLDHDYSSNRLIATDSDGPTGRVKFGTEGTNGLDTLTVRNVFFDRSRGFALESVDGGELKNILFTDIRMKNVSSSPIFIVLGDRGRAPVTGISSDQDVPTRNNVRVSEAGWVLPNLPNLYGSYPAVRYVPSYDKSARVTIGGGTAGAIAYGGDSSGPVPGRNEPRPISIVNPTAPTRLNPNSIKPDDPRFANAVGVGFAQVHDIVIRNVVVEDADPRYPILLDGLVDHPIRNVSISNVRIEYRGGLKMEDAVEQRQLRETWTYSTYQHSTAKQSLPWFVNTFFSKNEALLPRVSWDAGSNDGKGSWVDDPYNVPEMTREYPEPSMLGILPAYGIYARHVAGLRLAGVTLRYKVNEERPAVVLDDVSDSRFSDLALMTSSDCPAVVEVTNTKKREPDQEYVKDTPYKTTTVSNVIIVPSAHVEKVTVDRPSPGTPPDSLYAYPTAPSSSHPYAYAIPDDKYSLPLTVYRPRFEFIGTKRVSAGSELRFSVAAITPAPGAKLNYAATHLPNGARFDATIQVFSWSPGPRQVGTHIVKFTVDDGILPETTSVIITVVPSARK
jgi:pectate lyase-like protein/putative Ig domain-containing protein